MATQSKYLSNMRTTIKNPGGITVRFVEAINGFRNKFGYWPTKLEVDTETIAFMATVSFTPLGFFLVQSKIEISIGALDKMLAKGKAGDVFDYGEEGWESPSGHDHNARNWLGLDED